MQRLVWLVLTLVVTSKVALAEMTCGPHSSDFACGEPCALSGASWEHCSELPAADQERCRGVWESQVDARFQLTPKLGVRELQAIPEACRNRYESERLTVLEMIASGVPRGQPCPLKSDRSQCEGGELECRLYVSEQRLLMAPFSGAELRRIPERCQTDFMLEAIRTDRMHQRYRDMRWVVPWNSAGICHAKAEANIANALIEKEKRDARRLGIPVSERLQRTRLGIVEAASDLETASRRMLALARKPATPCSDPLVKQLVYCRAEEHASEEVCQTPKVRYFTESVEVTEGEYPVVDDERVTQPLSVRSDPTGQEVWLDGEKVGATPLMLDKVVGGEHVLEIRGDPLGFEPWKSTLIIRPDAPPDAVQAKLVRREAKLEVSTSPPGARVEIDGQEIGKTDGSFQVLGGDRQLHLKLSGYIDVERVVSVTPESAKSLSFDLVRKGTGRGGRFLPADLNLQYAPRVPDLVIQPETKIIRTKGPLFTQLTVSMGFALGIIGGGFGVLQAYNFEDSYRGVTGAPNADIQTCWVVCPLVGVSIGLVLTTIVALAMPMQDERVPDPEAVEANTQARADRQEAIRRKESHDEEVDRAVIKANEPVEAALMQNRNAAR